MGLHPLSGLGLENAIVLLESIQIIQTIVEVHDDQDQEENPGEHGDAAQIDGEAIHKLYLTRCCGGWQECNLLLQSPPVERSTLRNNENLLPERA